MPQWKYEAVFSDGKKVVRRRDRLATHAWQLGEKYGFSASYAGAKRAIYLMSGGKGNGEIVEAIFVLPRKPAISKFVTIAENSEYWHPVLKIRLLRSGRKIDQPWTAYRDGKTLRSKPTFNNPQGRPRTFGTAERAAAEALKHWKE